MDIRDIRCPNCNAPAKVDFITDDGEIRCHCEFCKKYFVENENTELKIIDEARLREEELERERLEREKLEESIFLLERKKKLKRRRIWCLFSLAAHLLFGIAAAWFVKNSDRFDEEKALKTFAVILVWFMLAPIILSFTRPFVPKEKNDSYSGGKISRCLLYYVFFIGIAFAAMLISAALETM